MNGVVHNADLQTYYEKKFTFHAIIYIFFFNIILYLRLCLIIMH
jgi:hypothetical protein